MKTEMNDKLFIGTVKIKLKKSKMFFNMKLIYVVLFWHIKTSKAHENVYHI